MTWQSKIIEYCKNFNIPIEYLAETISEPKVVPMIRGKAFEFSTLLILQKILSPETWKALKTPMNAQLGSHDIDVEIQHVPTNTSIRVECKLAAKGDYKLSRDGSSTIAVKCMRSRTLGATKVASLAPRLGVSVQQLTIHNDQYLPNDFDLVVTSIGNAFYDTDADGRFIWNPTAAGTEFLTSILPNTKNIQEQAFNKIYVARARDLAISTTTGIRCTRRSCTDKENCGFIPNYPLMKFEAGATAPNRPWVPIEEIEQLISSFVQQ